MGRWCWRDIGWRWLSGAALAVTIMGANCTAGDTRRTQEPALSVLDPATVQRGRNVYLTNCAVCHGPNAQGAASWHQPDERGNMPPPPHDDSGHTWRHSDRQLEEIIRNGWRDPFNKTPDLTMPPFEGKLSEEEIRTVITYFKSLWSPKHRRYQLEETQKDRAGGMAP